MSWRILVPDLAAAVEAIAAGRLPRAGALWHVVSPLGRNGLVPLPREPARLGQLPLLEGTLSEPDPLLSDQPLDPTRDDLAVARHLTLRLPADVTVPLLTTVPAAFHGRVNDVLLTALVVAVAGWRRRHAQGQRYQRCGD